jgi:hypothetical protein
MRPDEHGKWSIFWFIEFQKRGAPHFHFFCSHSPVPNKVGNESRPETPIELARLWCSKAWYECVGSKDEKHLRAGVQLDYFRTGRAGTISYASKYARKQEQKTVPNEFKEVGRFWGVSGLRTTMSADFVVSDRQMMNVDGLAIRNKYKNGLIEMEKANEITIHRDFHGEIKWAYMKTDDARRRVLNATRILKLKMNALFDVPDYDWEPFDILEPEMWQDYCDRHSRGAFWQESAG